MFDIYLIKITLEVYLSIKTRKYSLKKRFALNLLFIHGNKTPELFINENFLIMKSEL